jgi:hypothetical protein
MSSADIKRGEILALELIPLINHGISISDDPVHFWAAFMMGLAGRAAQDLGTEVETLFTVGGQLAAEVAKKHEN